MLIVVEVALAEGGRLRGKVEVVQCLVKVTRLVLICP